DFPGLTSPNIHALALDSSNGTLWAGTEGGVCKLAPGDAQWTPLPPFGHESDLSALAVDPATGIVAAGTRKDGVQVWDSERWQPGRGLSNPQVWALIVDSRTTPSTCYAGTLGNGLYASTDGGRTWR